MDLDWATTLKEVNGINLANYFPQRRSYNSIVYVHKRYLEGYKHKENETEQIKKIKKNNQHDKSQQFNADELNKEKANAIPYNNENPVLEQTIRFAKNIVPLILSPCEDQSQLFYTIKTEKKHKKKGKKAKASSFEHHETNKDREDSKKIIETYRKVKKESISVKESFSQSSNNTLDDLNINQSLCCTFSEVSEKKYNKIGNSNTIKPSKSQKISISESFEAIATETTAGDGKIKINLMNERDKEFLSDSIKEPIIKALGEYISELHNTIANTEVSTVPEIAKINSQKLDNIIHKLTIIEKKLDDHHKMNESLKANIEMHEQKFAIYEKKIDSYEAIQDDTKKANKSKSNDRTEYKRVFTPKYQETKPKSQVSPLEDLEEDLIEIKEDYSSEEELHHVILDKRSKITLVEELEQEDKNADNLGGGEVPRTAKGVSVVGTKLERPKRIPARFCWTDAGKMN